MEDYTLYQGETLRLQVTVPENDAATAELFAYNETSNFSSTASFTDNVAVLNTTISDSQASGDYEYYIKITYTDGTTDILASDGECDDGDCPKPLITVCELETSE